MSKKVVHRQIHLFRDKQKQSVQTRFEGFCKRAVESLCSQNENGDPVFDAGKAKSLFVLEVSVTRLANDSLNFEFGHRVKEKHPAIPAPTVTSALVQNIGLAQSIKHEQLSLLDPTQGQPKPVAADEVKSDASDDDDVDDDEDA